jgi:tetratricopeptide (TPR) repeat protein
MTGIVVAAIVIAIPALAFVLWPLLRRRDRGAGLLPLPPDPREQLLEEKEAAYRALRELAFEHEAGHLSDDDCASLRDRYETRAAEILQALDALAVREERPAPRPADAAPARPWTRHPVTLVFGGVALLVFGVMLGLGVARYAEPDRAGGMAAPGSRPLAPPVEGGAAGATPSAANAPRGPVTPQVLGGMLRAARASLIDGRYGEAIAAYQAVLKRDPKNVDALTHLGLIVAIGGHADAALETFDRALRFDPNYAPALLYRGQVLYEVKKDYAGAVKSWDNFLAVVPDGEEHDRIAALVKDARAKARGAK